SRCRTRAGEARCPRSSWLLLSCRTSVSGSQHHPPQAAGAGPASRTDAGITVRRSASVREDRRMAEEEKADDVAIAWEQGRATNLENWEERVPIHERDYGLEEYRADPDHLSPVVRHDLAALAPLLPAGTVAGLDLCHLQCHIGTDTLSFARAGAHVTGVDFSPSALATAARLADELGLRATWVESDVLEAASAVEGWFDVVYTSIGTITWLADLDRWAAQI